MSGTARRSAAPPARAPREADSPVASLPGATPARAEALAALGVATLGDLLRLVPRRYEDRRTPVPLADLTEGGPFLVVARVLRSRAVRLRGGVALLEAALEDASGALLARWFVRGFVPTALPAGARYALFGRVRRKAGRLELVSPERERLEEGAEHAPGLVPVYPLTRGLTGPVLRRLVAAALPAAARAPDPLPPALVRDAGLPPLAEALAALHGPRDPEQAERARQRLAFEELLVHELGLARRRAARAALAAQPIPFPERVRARIRARLPFALTPAQERAVAEVVRDLERPVPMLRLLQGDVGSGKTLVAAFALLGAVAAARQGALLAPTEVLARQHHATLSRLLAGSRVRLALLVGGGRAAERARVRAALAAGEVDVVVGTHAVLTDDTRFHRLALVVVDEQHKFGVEQRRRLLAKGTAEEGGGRARVPHALVMTATPIPRTLALTVYGDLDVSVIDALPPGRAPVATERVLPSAGRAVLARVKATLARGEQAFVVYPLVGGAEGGAVRDATQGAARWARALPGRRVGLLHGRLPAAEKEAVLTAFRERRLDLLVATVVVEVGVDVPNATLLIVEHAERFGLTQLHQLRGRVGRGTQPATCVLVDRSDGEAAARLDVLVATGDGFRVAEEDLAQRGVGDLLGTRQHGRPAFEAVRLPRDLPLLARVREAAARLVGADPLLTQPEHRLLAARLLTTLPRAAADGG